MPTISVNNAEFSYQLSGQGPTLVLIAGWTAPASWWIPMMSDLTKYFQVLTFDNRGVGKTKDDGCELTAELMADDAAAIMDALGIEKAHVAGGSMGGYIAQRFALRHPDKLNKLGLFTTTPKWREACKESLYILRDLINAGTDLDIIIRMFLGYFMDDKFIKDPKNIEALKQEVLAMEDPITYENNVRQCNVFKGDNIPELKNIKAETLVIHGKEDIICLQYESELLANEIPNAKLVTLDCGHDLCHTGAKLTEQAMIDFFKE